ncbi:MAG: phosphatase PAP2 family protein [Thermodesulfobacteriota bacterium]
MCAGRVHGETCALFPGRFLGIVLAAVVLLLLSPPPVRAGLVPFPTDPVHHSENENITQIGDVLQIALPAVAGASTFIAGNDEGGIWDKEGTLQFAEAFGAAWSTTYVWKYAAHKLRPKASNSYSYPSGHSMGAFTGAAFIGNRYGWKLGLPAYLAAGFTGYSRIQAQAHFADDVTAGASVGILYNMLFTTRKKPPEFAVLPMTEEDGVGLMLLFADSGSGTASDAPRKSYEPFSPRFEYDFIFGPMFIAQNKISVPRATGTTFELSDFGKINDPTTSAALNLSLFLDEQNVVSLFWNPFEARDIGTFENPVSFGGKIYPAYTDIISGWRLYDVRLNYKHRFLPESPFLLSLGAGMMYQDIRVDMGLEDRSISSEVRESIVLPIAIGEIGYRFTRGFDLVADASGMRMDDYRKLDLLCMARFFLHERWKISGGYWYYLMEMKTDELRNTVVYQGPYASVAYQW